MYLRATKPIATQVDAAEVEILRLRSSLSDSARRNEELEERLRQTEREVNDVTAAFKKLSDALSGSDPMSSLLDSIRYKCPKVAESTISLVAQLTGDLLSSKNQLVAAQSDLSITKSKLKCV